MIYSDTTIRRRIEANELGIAPYYPDRLNPASYDVSLGRRVLTFRAQKSPLVRLLNRFGLGPVHDIREKPQMVAHEIGPEGMVLWPGVAYLLATEETFDIPKDVVAVLDGKSSLGRLFIKVHETAGYIDPGFKGHVTLEVTAMLPVRIFAGIKIGQVRFHTLTEPVENTYDKVGHYRDHLVDGPVESYFWAAMKERPDPFGAVMVIPRLTPSGGIEFLAVSRPKASADNIGMPGGKVDPGETAEQAAVRETVEETGVEVTACQYIGTHSVVPGENIRFFLATDWKGEARQMEERTRVRWAPYEDFCRPSCTFGATYRDWLHTVLPKTIAGRPFDSGRVGV